MLIATAKFSEVTLYTLYTKISTTMFCDITLCMEAGYVRMLYGGMSSGPLKAVHKQDRSGSYSATLQFMRQ